MITSTTTIGFKKTKAEIIQRLLEEKHITVEEAMTLMMSEEKQTPIIPTIPSHPHYPFTPYYYMTTSNGVEKVNFSENQIQK